MTDFLKDPLWRRIDGFELDDMGAALTFTRRLARDNGWTNAFAARAVEEYKRFCYLAFRAGHPVTPSDEVDQAWHLHLAYTRSYWDEFCGEVLGGPLHHGPTKGGRAEGAKFRDWYQTTRDSYVRIFGTPPPDDIWPDTERRFHNAGSFRRINTSSVWLIPKPAIRRAAPAAGMLPVALVALAACTELDGGGIAGGTVLVIAVAVLLAMIISIKRPNSGRGDADSDGGGFSFFAWFDSSDGDSDSGCGGCGD